MPVKKRDKGKMRATLTAAQPPAGGANPSPPGRGGWGHPGSSAGVRSISPRAGPRPAVDAGEPARPAMKRCKNAPPVPH